LADVGTELLVGGHVHSPSSPDATAMAVTDGMVVWLGADQPGRALHPDAEITELDGAFVAPAFVDAHVHVTGLGLTMTGLDLTEARSVADCLRLLREHAAAHPEGVIIGHGWDESRWPQRRAPQIAELDAAAGSRPVYLTRIDCHSAVCSTAMLAAAPGVDRAAGFERGAPVRAAAHHVVRARALAARGRVQRDAARRAALDAAAAAGVVAVHECAGPDIGGRDDLAELLRFDHGVEVRAYWGQRADSAEHAASLLAETGAHGLAGDLFVDGSLGSHTAWLSTPYADRDTTGLSYLDPDAIATHLRACTEAGIQAGFHVIGDAAVGAVLRGLERVAAELGGPAVAACAHRLEHLEMITADQAARLGALGVVASVQPGFDACWGGPDGMYAARLGTDRAAGLNPFATLAAAGVPLAFGSDAPVTPLNPWAAVRAAVHHRTAGHGITPRAAFGAATRGAWRAAGVRDGVAGTLVPGAAASYTVWDADQLVVASGASGSDPVRRWSTDPRSRVPALPRLDPDAPLPRCLRTVHRGTTIHGK
jgi:predicted amidohydrolase YtcJ